MREYRTLVFSALVGMLLLGAAHDATAAERRRIKCERGYRVRVQDLDMSPDPIKEGAPIKRWRVRLNVDGNVACDTVIELRDRDGDVVAREREYRLRPGINEITLEPRERYRFKGKEKCFNVVIDIEGTRRTVDEDRGFCARYRRDRWTMREEGDEGIRKEQQDRDKSGFDRARDR